MRPQTIFYYLVETGTSLRRNIWMTLASVLTIALAMTILGVFASVVTNLDYLTSTVESQIEITCYVKNSVTEDMLTALKQKIYSIDGVESVRFVSRSEGLEQLKERLNWEGLLQGYEEGNNPLPNSFIVRARTPSLTLRVSSVIELLEEIDEVRDGNQYVTQIINFSRLVRVFGTVIMAGLAAAALFIVVNTIRLTIFARRGEIEIMRYVGATNHFIRVPFFLEGLVLGIAGSCLAHWVTVNLYHSADASVRAALPILAMAPAYPFLDQLFWWILLCGVLFGVIGSMITLGRYLKA